MRHFIAVVAVALALPAAALAEPGAQYPPASDQRSSEPVQARGTDVAAPDQQSPATSEPVQARGTDVAAPDQQSPLVRVVEIPSAGPSTSEFDWTDALIGAAATLGALSLLGAAGVTVRRRRSGVAIS